MLNKAGNVALYRFVQRVKFFSVLGFMGLGFYETMMFEKKQKYYDRFYPEPTQLQRSLVTEAQVMLKREEMGLDDESAEERAYMDPRKQQTYSQFYQLAPQNHSIAEEAFNAPDHQQH